MIQPSGTPAPASRRAVVAAAGAAGLTAALAACGGADSGSDAGSADSAAPDREKGAGGSGAAGQELSKTADIPEGGGTVFQEQKVVVTQPTAGEFKAYSAVCTHQGCLVSDVSDGTINCGCHGSKFDIADGSVSAGPASHPLPSAQVTVENGTVRLS